MTNPGYVMTRAVSAVHRALYRATGGRLGAAMRGAPILLLTTTGSHSGRARTSPLMYVRDGEDYVVVASNAGRDFHPAWWQNLRANPEARIQARKERTSVHAEEVTPGPERDRLWAAFVAVFADYAAYEKRTTRPIPVVRLRTTQDG